MRGPLDAALSCTRELLAYSRAQPQKAVLRTVPARLGLLQVLLQFLDLALQPVDGVGRTLNHFSQLSFKLDYALPASDKSVTGPADDSEALFKSHFTRWKSLNASG